jgi:hypothetical protein
MSSWRRNLTAGAAWPSQRTPGPRDIQNKTSVCTILHTIIEGSALVTGAVVALFGEIKHAKPC